MPRVFVLSRSHFISRSRFGVALFLGLSASACTPSGTARAPGTSLSVHERALDGVRLLGMLDQLASDALGGRYSTHPDILLAAQVITTQYEASGVAPGADTGYLVNYEIAVGIDRGPDDAVALGPDASIAVPTEAFVPRPEGITGTAQGPVVFVGYGMTLPEGDEFANLPLTGAVAVLLVNAPPAAPGADGEPARRPPRLGRRLERLAQAGAVAVILVDDPAALRPSAGREVPTLPDLAVDEPLRRRVEIPVVQLHAGQADSLIFADGIPALSELQAEIDATGTPRSQPLTGLRARVQTDVRARTVVAPNILAVVPGTDLADEIVLLGAHYDHIGTAAPGHGHCKATAGTDPIDAICNGADDNASGSAIVAELAIAMTHAERRPRRTVVFAHFSGEEMGLLGSRDLAAHLDTQPPFTGRTVVAMLNIDMVGRLRERLTVSGVGSSDAWMPILDGIGPRGMRVLYDRSLTTRSDHAPFYELDIPALFFFTEVHDDYHAPGDESAGILRDGVISVAGMVGAVASVLADGHDIAFAPPRRPEEGLVPALPGDDPSTIEKEIGPS